MVVKQPVVEPVRAVARRAAIGAIIDAAADIITEGGEEMLTMRRLANRCGMAPMSLYRYVDSRDDVLAELADRYLAEVRLPATRRGAWRKTLITVFESIHDVFLRHPALAQILATHPRDQLSAYRIPEFVLTTLMDAGMRRSDAIAGFEALRSYTAGFSSRELARRADIGKLDERKSFVAGLPSEEFPRCRECAPGLVGGDMSVRFRAGLEVVVDGVGSRMPARKRGGRR